MKKVTCFLTAVFFILGCTETKQVSNFKEMAAKHKTLALLPAFASFLLSETDKNKISQEQINDSELKLSFMIQDEMNKWFQKNKKSYRITLLDIKKTNDLLFSKGMSFKTFRELSKDTLAKMLNVDAVVFCNVNLSKKFDNKDYNTFLALGIGLPFLGSRFKVVTQIGVVENTSPAILWQKEYLPNGKIDEDIFSILRRMLKTAVVDFPYKK